MKYYDNDEMASLERVAVFAECMRDGFVLLLHGDVMTRGDESLRLHDRKWIPLPQGWDGQRWEENHWPPVRRKVDNKP